MTPRPGRPGGDGPWRLWVDTGGTFTDCIAIDPAGRSRRIKVLSSGSVRGRLEERLDERTVRLALPYDLPSGFFEGAQLFCLGDPSGTRVTGFREGGVARLAASLAASAGTPCEIVAEEASPVLAARIATSTPIGRALPPIWMRLATTRGTNALLERSGSPTALFITRGFADLLEIGNQQRPDLFALRVRKRRPLYARVVEVGGRLDPVGREELPLDEDAVRRSGRDLVEAGVLSAAVALVHSYREPAHERRVRQILLEAGMRHVSCSADLAPLIRLLPRAETAVVDAYLSEVIDDYLASVRGAVAGGRLQVMTSAGGLRTATRFRPKESLLSGPAAGVVGAARAGRLCSRNRVLSFDMGGTSTDVARYDGEYDYQFETRVGDAWILAPALAIETVAAGGGSICRFDGRQLKVGPESSGADPGPACYGAGGPLTLTDVNLLLGRLDPGQFEIPLSRRAAEAAVRGVEADLDGSGMGLERDALLLGLLSIANERMVEAIRRISVRKGYDPTGYALVAFGGAGGQHALALATLLGMRTVLVPADAGLLSARGLGHALVERFVERQVLEPLAQYERRAADDLESLGVQACEALAAEGEAVGEVVVRRRLVSLRLFGQESTLDVDYSPGCSLGVAFAAAYADHFGYPPSDRDVEVESVRVVASARGEALPAPVEVAGSEATPAGVRRCLIDDAWLEVPLYERDDLAVGAGLRGPALVVERFSATVVEGGWSCQVDPSGALLLEREKVG